MAGAAVEAGGRVKSKRGATAWSDLDVRMADLEQSRSQQRRLQAEVRGAPDRLVHIS